MSEGSLYIGGQQYESPPAVIDTEVSFAAVSAALLPALSEAASQPPPIPLALLTGCSSARESSCIGQRAAAHHCSTYLG